MAATGVRVISRDGTDRVYDQARAVTRDGNADFELRDDTGQIVATRRRETVESVEVIYG